MFEVKATGLVDNRWEERDLEMAAVVGRRSDRFSVTSASDTASTCEYLWQAKTWEDAKRLQHRLSMVDGVRDVAVREK